MTESPLLSADDVRHVARLARLNPSDAAIESLRPQLAAILTMFGHLDALDLDNVEPLTHPLEITNRLRDDEPDVEAETIDAADLAPAHEDVFIAVPRARDGGGA